MEWTFYICIAYPDLRKHYARLAQPHQANLINVQNLHTI